MRALTPSEEQTQATIVQWLRMTQRTLVAAIPNGTCTTNAGRMKARREGLSKGAPDLVVAWNDEHGPRTLWIECKSEAGRLTKEQIFWRDALIGMGHDWLLARSLDDVMGWFQKASARAGK